MGVFIFLLCSIAMIVVLIFYFLWDTCSKVCPKCKKSMIVEYIDGKQAFICKVCGHIEYKNNKI